MTTNADTRITQGKCQHGRRKLQLPGIMRKTNADGRWKELFYYCKIVHGFWPGSRLFVYGSTFFSTGTTGPFDFPSTGGGEASSSERELASRNFCTLVRRVFAAPSRLTAELANFGELPLLGDVGAAGRPRCGRRWSAKFPLRSGGTNLGKRS